MSDTVQLPDEITFDQIQALQLENVCYQYAVRGSWPKKGFFNSTSFFIDKNFLLTSAHNVVKTVRNVNSLAISPARLGENYHFGTFNLSKVTQHYVRIYPGYQFSKDSTWGPYDVALIYIPDAILEKNPDFTFYNTLPLLTDLSSLENGEELFCAGYPAQDEHIGRYWMTLDISTLLERKEHFFKHTLDTVRGNSGSPIMVKRNDQFYVIGVNSIGHKGTLINQEKLDWIEACKKSFLGQ